jgi:hypothetical protein
MGRGVFLDTVVSTLMTKVGGALALRGADGPSGHDALVATGSVLIAVGLADGYRALVPAGRYVAERTSAYILGPLAEDDGLSFVERSFYGLE